MEETLNRGMPVHTKSFGLVISLSYGCLACSPDGWIDDSNTPDSHGVVEYKCPYALRDVTPVEACNQNFSAHWTMDS